MVPIEEMPDSAAGRRRLVQPLGGLLVVAGVIVALVLTLGVAGMVSGSGMALSYPGLGSAPVCANVDLNGIGLNGDSPTLVGMRPGATIGVPNPISECVLHATAGQRALVFLASAPHSLFYLVSFALVAWLLLIARREGPFVPRVHRLLRVLGWFLLAGSVVVAVSRNLANAYFLASTVTVPVPIAADAMSTAALGVPLLIGCALLTLARIMRAASRMSADLEGTV